MLQQVTLILLLVMDLICSQRLFPNGTRNKYEWPFLNTSIWNWPIGSNAQYVPAGINGSTNFGIDYCIWLIATASDPRIEWYKIYEWDERCVVNSSNSAQLYPYKPIFPSNTTIADATIVPHHTPNNDMAILLPDGESLFQTGATCKNTSGSSPLFAHNAVYAQDIYSNPPTFVSIYSNGTLGSHGGSGLRYVYIQRQIAEFVVFVICFGKVLLEEVYVWVN